MSKRTNDMQLVERDMTPAELERMYAGFREHAVANGRIQEDSRRFGFVAISDTGFIGCSSGLAYRVQERFLPWFHLTDLFVERPYRGRGLGGRLLGALEARVGRLGVANVYLWTAGDEAPGFYRSHGYEVRGELDDYYGAGIARTMMAKRLEAP